MDEPRVPRGGLFRHEEPPELDETCSGRVPRKGARGPVMCRHGVWPMVGAGRPGNGAGDRNRTGDPVITSDVLYQLSYTSLEFESREALPWGVLAKMNGATPQNRTADTHVFSVVLYQLS